LGEKFGFSLTLRRAAAVVAKIMAIQWLIGVGGSTLAAACGGAAGNRKLTLDRRRDRLALAFQPLHRDFAVAVPSVSPRADMNALARLCTFSLPLHFDRQGALEQVGNLMAVGMDVPGCGRAAREAGLTTKVSSKCRP
jgi:hypothetical protein